LTAEKPEQQWNFDEEEEDTDFFEHVLFLRSAVLGKGAVEGERNIVELETKNFEGQVMKQPLISLTLGRNDMTMLDMNFSHETSATFRLIEGTGPVYLAAMHQTEFPVEDEEDGDETEEDNGTDLEYTEDGDTATQDSEGTDGEGSGKKRKAGAMKKSKKRGKLDSTESAPTSTAEENTEEEEDEDEDMDEDEDDEEEEESEDGSGSEDIEESPSTKKKTKKNDAKTKGAKAKVSKKPVKALKNGKAAGKKVKSK